VSEMLALIALPVLFLTGAAALVEAFKRWAR